MFDSSFKIARVWGIPIKIHISLIVLLLVLALSLGMVGDWDQIVLVLLLEAGVFTSIALHELGHAFVAMRKGCRVREITLMFIGGAAQMESMPRRPLDEFLMAIAGPAVSVALGFLCWFGGARLHLPSGWWPLPFTHHLAIRCNLVQFVGVVNLALAVFNLIPAFPTDGGRIFRALLTPRLGRLRATSIAARTGRFAAVLIGLYGLMRFARGGWILVAIASFLYSAAGREYRMVQMQEIGWRPGVPPWWPFGRPRQPPPLDRVTISPPPYERGPKQQADLRSEDGE